MFSLGRSLFPIMPRRKRKYHTYCEGPRLKFKRDVTRKQYMEMLETIEHALNNDLDPRERKYRILPEKIAEGGFQMVSYPGYEEGQYKSIRHHLFDADNNCCKWPYIHGTEEEMVADWKANGSSRIFLSKGSKAETFLKAFRGAPLWTQEELRTITTAMQPYGIAHTRIPGKRRLKTWIGLLHPHV